MKRYLLILLMMCLPAWADTACYFGGSSSDADNAGWALSTVHVPAANGTYHAHVTDATWTVADGVMTKVGAFTTVVIGDWVNVVGGTHMTAGRYIITARTDDTITISTSAGTENANHSDIHAHVGGALPLTAANIQSYAVDAPLGAAQNVTAYLYDGGTSVAWAAEVTFDTGDAAGAGYTKKFIGCDLAYASLALGSYCTLDAVGTDLGAPFFHITAAGVLNNIQFRNIALQHNNSAGGNPAANENGWEFDTGAASYGQLFFNCSVHDVYTGWDSSPNDRSVLIDCRADNCQNKCISTATNGGMLILRGYYEAESGAEIMQLIGSAASMSIGNCIFSGGTNAINQDGISGVVVIRNCSFWNQTTACIDNSGSAATILAENNIFYVNTPASDYAIRTTSTGLVFERNNVSNATAAAQSGFVAGSGSTDSLTFSSTSPFVNTATPDFRLHLDDVNVTTYCLDKGARQWMDGDADNTVKGYQSLGAWQATQVQSGGYVHTGTGGGFDQ
jgi:hypothetical protein